MKNNSARLPLSIAASGKRGKTADAGPSTTGTSGSTATAAAGRLEHQPLKAESKRTPSQVGGGAGPVSGLWRERLAYKLLRRYASGAGPMGSLVQLRKRLSKLERENRVLRTQYQQLLRDRPWWTA